jgi:hypothetical protein
MSGSTARPATSQVAATASRTAASAHVDRFVRDHLPAPQAQPEFLFELPELQLPPRLNCASWLLDRRIDELGEGARRCIVSSSGTVWSYAELRERARPRPLARSADGDARRRRPLRRRRDGG